MLRDLMKNEASEASKSGLLGCVPKIMAPRSARREPTKTGKFALISKLIPKKNNEVVYAGKRGPSAGAKQQGKGMGVPPMPWRKEERKKVAFRGQRDNIAWLSPTEAVSFTASLDST